MVREGGCFPNAGFLEVSSCREIIKGKQTQPTLADMNLELCVRRALVATVNISVIL